MAIASSFLNGVSSQKFGDPFLLPSTASFPSDIRSTLDLCLYLYRTNRLYGAIANRVVSWFITDVEFVGKGDKKEQEKLKTMLVDTLGVFTHMQQAGMEWAIYGNGFFRCVEPFDRWLIDDRSGGYRAIALDQIPEHLVTYDWEKMTYLVPDMAAAANLPKSQRKASLLPKVALRFRDKPSQAAERFSIIRLDPRYVELDKAHHSNQVEYIYRIPPEMTSRVKRGVLNEVNNTPRGLLEAIAKSKDFRFRRGEIYHFRAPTPTGVSDSGWAPPEILMHYDALYQLAVYRKADSAIALDFLHPIRFFTPNFGSTMGDTVAHMLMSQWKQEMQNMIRRVRKDPTSIHALPFDVNYKESGTDGKNMVMYDVIEAYTTALFDGMGFPRELFRGSLNVEQIPHSSRMFERHYEWLYNELNGLLQFISRVVQRAYDADELQVRLKRPSVAYNAEWMQLKMQLAANREIPRADVYPDIGITDPENAAARAISEDQDIQRMAADLAAGFEKEKTQGSMADIAMMQAEQGAQQAAQGGAPGQPGPQPGGLDYSVDANADPSMVLQRAQEVAMQWQQMHEQSPNSHRKEMQAAEAINPTLHAAAKQALEKIRAQGASAGRSQAGSMLANSG